MVKRTDGAERITLPPGIQQAWIRELRSYYDHYNSEYLKGCLQPPLILLGLARDRLGEWDAVQRSITISEAHILEHTWENVLDTLRHEMAHQYVHEVLGMTQARPHGDAFARACRLLRCDASARASAAKLTDPDAAERSAMVQRVRELLALAGSPNEHEAAAAMRMANKYLLKHNLSLAETKGHRDYEVRYLGSCSGRIQEYEYRLSNILQQHFFVLIIWTFSYDPFRNRRGRVLQISGTPENLEIASYVYDYVLWTAKRLWEEYRVKRGRGGGTKLQYLAGLVRGFGEKLDEQSRTLARQEGLVWRGDPELQEFFRDIHPRVSMQSTSGVSRTDGFHAGVRDGRDITIRRGVGTSRNRGRLLDG